MPHSPTNKRLCLSAATMLAVIVIDQIIKVYVKTHFLLHESVDVTPWFKLVFIENRGMAFGMDFIGTAVLTVFRIAAIIFFCYILRKAAKGLKPFGLILCIALIIAGAAGNIIDNCLYGLIFTESLPYVPSIPFDPAAFTAFGEGYGSFLTGRVVDMFYFPLFTWPDWLPLVGGDVFFGAIFNFADAAISCGAIAILLFYNKHLLKEAQPSPTPEQSEQCD